jgi:casein kinase II subunit alpha
MKKHEQTQNPAVASLWLPNPRITTTVSNGEESNTDKIIEILNRRRSMSKARVYTDVNVLRPKEYWDYESLAVQWG